MPQEYLVGAAMSIANLPQAMSGSFLQHAAGHLRSVRLYYVFKLLTNPAVGLPLLLDRPCGIEQLAANSNERAFSIA